MVKLANTIKNAQKQAIHALTNIQNVIEEINGYAVGEEDFEELLEQRIKAQEDERMRFSLAQQSPTQAIDDVNIEGIQIEYERLHSSRIEEQETSKRRQSDSDMLRAEAVAHRRHLKILEHRADLVDFERRQEREIKETCNAAEEIFAKRQARPRIK